MGFIREPDGVDFVICSAPLTAEARAEIVAAIAKHKQEEAAHQAAATKSKPPTKRRKTVARNQAKSRRVS